MREQGWFTLGTLRGTPDIISGFTMNQCLTEQIELCPRSESVLPQVSVPSQSGMSGAPSTIPARLVSPAILHSPLLLSLAARAGAVLSPAKVKISLAHAPDTLKS